MAKTDWNVIRDPFVFTMLKQASTTPTKQTALAPVHQPTPADVPPEWYGTGIGYYAPGAPIFPMVQPTAGWRSAPEREPRGDGWTVQEVITDADGKFKVRTNTGMFEPRSYQYKPAVNTSLVPRVGHSLSNGMALMSFADIQAWAEDTPDCMGPLGIITEETKSFVRKIVHDDGETCGDPDLQWLINYPDKHTPFAAWISRFAYNTLFYNAPAINLVRSNGDNPGEITALRVIDGSTIFCLIDERGEQPEPPAPAFLQIILGIPFGFLSTEQLWYQPRRLRPDSPYGISPIESGFGLVKILNQMWKYELGEYTEGNMPEMLVESPPGWTAGQIAEFEQNFNAELAGNLQVRRRLKFVPSGTKMVGTKQTPFNLELYQNAKRGLMEEHFLLTMAEVGEVSGRGLGGKGFMEQMAQTIFRKTLRPWIDFIATPFNDVLRMNHTKCKDGKESHKVVFDFPPDSIDPEKEAKKLNEQWTTGAISWGEYRDAQGLEPWGDDRDKWVYLQKGAGFMKPDGTVVGGAPQPVPAQNPEEEDEEQENAVPKEQDKAPQDFVSVNKTSEAEARKIGNSLGIDWGKIDIDEFRMGIAEEAEHRDVVGSDPKKWARIALAHLKEDPKYYSKLKTLHKRNGNFTNDSKIEKHCGVCPEDSQYFGAPVSRETTIEFPVQGANESEIVSVAPKGLDPRPAIFKPEGEESEVLNTAIGHHQYCAEQAVYLVDRAMGEPYLVPVSYNAQVDDEHGAIILYVMSSGDPRPANEYGMQYIEKAAVLDYLTGQTDRDKTKEGTDPSGSAEPHKNSGWVTHPDDDSRPVLIDQGLAFPTAETTRSIASAFINAWKGRPFGAAVLDALVSLRNNVLVWKQVRDSFTEDANRESILELTMQRLDQMIDRGAIPMEKRESRWALIPVPVVQKMDAPKPEINVHVAQPAITVVMPRQEIPMVKVDAPVIQAAPITVNVPGQEAPNVTVENVVNVPQQEAPVIKVEPSPVHPTPVTIENTVNVPDPAPPVVKVDNQVNVPGQEPPNVTVVVPDTEVTETVETEVKRDRYGQMTGAVSKKTRARRRK